MKPDTIELKDIDIEEIEFLLVKVEDSFGIKFADNELVHVQTFGELCDNIKSKIQRQHTDDCTTQQAFYKLRSAVSTSLNIAESELSPDTSLRELLPRNGRRIRTRQIEQNLGLKLSILRPPRFVSGMLVLFLLASFIALFIDPVNGLLGLGLSIGGFYISTLTGKEMDLETLGQVAGKMARENYMKSRRNPVSINSNEIEKVLTDLFSADLGVDKRRLTRDAPLF